MIAILGNIIADILLYVDRFPIEAGALQGVSHLATGPGGACNVAIMARRLGLDVLSLGEVGDDEFGLIVLQGLRREGVNVEQVFVSDESKTPVAGVLVDPAGEPAYLGFPGHHGLAALPEAWRAHLAGVRALFVDGWIEYPAMAAIAIEALRVVRDLGGRTFFDPGPGNPRQDNRWQWQAAALATVVLLNEQEALRLTGAAADVEAAHLLLQNGSELVVLKRGAQGCTLYTPRAVVHAPGLPVQVVDKTGAGDSLAAAVIGGMLHGLPLEELGKLANAVGAAKVGKVGTGHQVPTAAEIKALLDRFDIELSVWF